MYVYVAYCIVYCAISQCPVCTYVVYVTYHQPLVWAFIYQTTFNVTAVISDTC